MKRCTKDLLKAMPAVMLAFSAILTAVPASAQSDTPVPENVRNFPKAALRGMLVVRTPPEISMNGKADRLSPGARIRNVNNTFVTSGALIGQELPVNYTRDSAGLVHEVWILNAAEVQEKREGMPARNFSFGFESTPAAQDDGKTPYDQLPRYKQ
ncbi:MAG TPA: hypothetical protein VE934_16760 [Polaromonas sp.]|uniref:hypothetical protein n=1 Tax=Polaromonas sp. TaxID=1869339 RepID=UPI002D41B102|nr:hypothetical protein [Polaromonas sp.]HYW58602.1 hypothetical protein [Polaromonas sp.]